MAVLNVRVLPGAVSWKAGMDLYYQDKVVEALQIVQPDAGAFSGNALGQYRLIEGEARTRQVGETRAIGERLNLEFVPREVPHHDAVGSVVAEAAATVSKRLQWDRRESTLATVLVSEADADWNEARYGYCVDKVPYDKICLPHVSTLSPQELWRVAAHEFAHVVVLNTAQKMAPHWVDEGIACLMEGRSVTQARMRLRARGFWRGPHHIEGEFDVDRREAANLPSVAAAYDQSTVLVAYLHAEKDDEGLVSLLNSMPDHSNLADFIKKLVSSEPFEVALHRVYGYGQEELFARAAEWAGVSS